MRQKIDSESIASTSTMPIAKKIELDKLNSISAFTSLQINEAINDCRVLENIHQILKDRLVTSKTMITEKKEQEIKIEKERQEYDLQVRDWERYEDERCRNSSRYNSIKKKQVNDRKKAIIHDKELVCSDEELSNWQRKLVRF